MVMRAAFVLSKVHETLSTASPVCPRLIVTPLATGVIVVLVPDSTEHCTVGGESQPAGTVSVIV